MMFLRKMYFNDIFDDSDNEIQSQLDGYILQLKKRLKDV